MRKRVRKRQGAEDRDPDEEREAEQEGSRARGIHGLSHPSREFLQLIKKNFSKVARYKSNSNKSVAFLYSKDK